MSVIVEKPYVFVPPHRGNRWPSFIQRFRLVDFYLRRKAGVVSYECRHADRLRASLARGDGILLAPNHCRYADPLVLGWLSREVGRHLFSMASWHLFNHSWLDRFSIPRMGGFSVFREGIDRQSLEMAIEILTEAKRPLMVFPEGTTSRVNDALQPLLDGVLFMARTAAKRRMKADPSARVVIHPVAIKYVFRGDIWQWVNAALAPLEQRLSWPVDHDGAILPRLMRIAQGILALKEAQYFGAPQQGSLPERRTALIERLLQTVEQLDAASEPLAADQVLARVRQCRAKLSSRLLDTRTSEPEKVQLRRLADQVDLAQQLHAYPTEYLDPQEITDTRLLETVERMHEDFLGRPISPSPLHAIIEVGEAIHVPDAKHNRNGEDNLLKQLDQNLREMLVRLSREARPLPHAELAVASGLG